MNEFTLKISDMPPNTTPEQEKELAMASLSIFDGDWCFILTGLQSCFNQESRKIQELISKVNILRDLCGEINNIRVCEWQKEYFKHQEIHRNGGS